MKLSKLMGVVAFLPLMAGCGTLPTQGVDVQGRSYEQAPIVVNQANQALPTIQISSNGGSPQGGAASANGGTGGTTGGNGGTATGGPAGPGGAGGAISGSITIGIDQDNTINVNPTYTYSYGSSSGYSSKKRARY